MSIYTDLALEARELDAENEGVSDENESLGDIEITRIKILTESAAKRIGKRMGKYVTIDARRLTERPLDLFERVSKNLASEISGYLKGMDTDSEIMIAGLGNRNVTPDALGPRVAEKVFITRHIKQYLPDALDYPMYSTASVVPGVLGTTGVETLELIKGLAEKLKPDLIIAIDSLASRRAARISTTIQLSDAGIDPGSGVGNIRSGLNEETIGVPVLAIGVPLVVYASTITQDAISLIAGETGSIEDKDSVNALADKVINEKMDGLIVTPKDIDRIVEDMSGIVADGINRALYGDHYDELKMLLL
ncbi:MAG: GPR endopeptidase [Clostridiales bacterium]|nr:GPR endopeptidase [Clostridiales bacterium]